MVNAGQLLSKERIRRRLTLEDVAKETKIKARFLAAIEKGEYAKLPSPAYAQGFVINYAAFLGIPKSEIAPLFRREFDHKKAFKVLPDSLVKTEEFPLKRIKMQQSFLLAGVVFFLFLLYLLFQYRSAFIAPSLTVSSPKQQSIVSDQVTVSGKTDENATVLVNDEPTSVSSDGKFIKILGFFPGKTTIKITAKNKFGKERVVEREVVVK